MKKAVSSVLLLLLSLPVVASRPASASPTTYNVTVTVSGGQTLMQLGGSGSPSATLSVPASIGDKILFSHVSAGGGDAVTVWGRIQMSDTPSADCSSGGNCFVWSSSGTQTREFTVTHYGEVSVGKNFAPYGVLEIGPTGDFTVDVSVVSSQTRLQLAGSGVAAANTVTLSAATAGSVIRIRSGGGTTFGAGRPFRVTNGTGQVSRSGTPCTSACEVQTSSKTLTERLSWDYFTVGQLGTITIEDNDGIYRSSATLTLGSGAPACDANTGAGPSDIVVTFVGGQTKLNGGNTLALDVAVGDTLNFRACLDTWSDYIVYDSTDNVFDGGCNLSVLTCPLALPTGFVAGLYVKSLSVTREGVVTVVKSASPATLTITVSGGGATTTESTTETTVRRRPRLNTAWLDPSGGTCVVAGESMTSRWPARTRRTWVRMPQPGACERPGYEFGGWQSGAELVAAGQQGSSRLNWTAIWTPVSSPAS